ncbi:MAG: hypothetical protein A7316_03450 [Candidatus Altiarchaeales archaeon WOR_SM1_86-2]|nr:MAG: hypothetical protein A7316_03450 [Candidatus Altiarchaeales archaeon WOR_SM1_86-2]
MESKKDVGGLIKALKYKSDDIRVSAACALRKVGDKRAVKHLIQALHDEVAAVQNCALYALGKTWM